LIDLLKRIITKAMKFMSRIKDIKRIRSGTGLPLAECSTLLKDFNTPEKVIEFYKERRTLADECASRMRSTRARIQDDWWIKDFLCRPEGELQGSGDPENGKWRNKLLEYFRKRKAAENNPANRISEIQDYISKYYFDTEHNAEIENRRMVWSNAFWTHRVPRFEPTWLSQLKEDPFGRLRTLREKNVSKRLLVRNATYSPGVDVEEKAKYISAAIKQSEEYYLAAARADSSIRPLLLYYMTTCIMRAVLSLRIPHLARKYRTHGLAITKGRKAALDTFSVEMTTTTEGLFHAIRNGLPGGPIGSLDVGPWTLLELCRYIPELKDTLKECLGLVSYTQENLIYEQHEPYGTTIPGRFHIGVTLPNNYFNFIGVKVGKKLMEAEKLKLAKEIHAALPGVVWKIGDSYRGDTIHNTYSPVLDDQVVALVRHADNRHEQLRAFPLLFEGGLDGLWYVVYNQKSLRPQQLALFTVALYGLSMLVRYRSMEWEEMMKLDDGSYTVIERLSRVALIKIPILATEWLFARKILGNLEGVS